MKTTYQAFLDSNSERIAEIENEVAREKKRLQAQQIIRSRVVGNILLTKSGSDQENRVRCLVRNIDDDPVYMNGVFVRGLSTDGYLAIPDGNSYNGRRPVNENRLNTFFGDLQNRKMDEGNYLAFRYSSARDFMRYLESYPSEIPLYEVNMLRRKQDESNKL